MLDAMATTFPDAAIWCLWNDAQERYPIERVRETWLARTPLRRSKPASLPLMPLTWRSYRADNVEWVLASSHLFAHHVRPLTRQGSVRKLAYVYTPARYLWNPELDPRGSGVLPRIVSPLLRRLDRRRASEAIEVAAISDFVRSRIRAAWDRDARVIYPPVEVTRIQSLDWRADLADSDQAVLEQLPETFVLGASRFVSYKRLDLVIKAGEAAGLPVVIAGAGPEGIRLREQGAEASVPVNFIENPSDALLYSLYAAAAVFVFPAVEDFGIMPVEAMSLGTPVVGNRRGGVSETVVDGVSGVLVDDWQSPRRVARAVHMAMDREAADCAARSQNFDREKFAGQLRDWVR